MTKTLKDSLKYYLSFLKVTEADKKKEEQTLSTGKIQTIRHNRIIWSDVRNPGRKEISEIAEGYPFHPLHLEDSVSRSQPLKIEQNDEDKYLFLLLRFPRLNIDGSIATDQICFFLGKTYLVTIHDSSTDAISKIFADCRENALARKTYLGNHSAHLLYTIISQLTDNLAPLLQQILREVEEAEDVVFDDKTSGVYQIGLLRRKIISSRRVIGPLRTLLAEITARINKFSAIDFSVYFEDTTQQVEKAWETLEEARETVEIYKDADFTFSTEKTNRILAALTVVFTLTIPATVIGTFYGMNILVPGGKETGSWTFWGPYTTFIIILIVSAVSALLMYLSFRKRNWF